MNRTSFNKLLELLSGVDKQCLDRIGGSLRREGMVSVGGRGLNAPELTPTDAANIVLGLLSTDNASRAAEKVKEVSDWQSSRGNKFGETIAAILSHPTDIIEVSYISIYRNFPEATIGWSTITPDFVGGDEPTPDKEVFRPEGVISDAPGFLVEAFLKGSTISAIVKILREIEKDEKKS